MLSSPAATALPEYSPASLPVAMVSFQTLPVLSPWFRSAEYHWELSHDGRCCLAVVLRAGHEPPAVAELSEPL